MDLDLFTPAFRVRLRLLAQTATGRQARLLAAKLSPLLSAFAALFALQLFPGYGYITLALIVCVVLLLGAAVAFVVPAPFIMLLRFIAADPSHLVIWPRRKEGQGGES